MIPYVPVVLLARRENSLLRLVARIRHNKIVWLALLALKTFMRRRLVIQFKIPNAFCVRIAVRGSTYLNLVQNRPTLFANLAKNVVGGGIQSPIAHCTRIHSVNHAQHALTEVSHNTVA